MDPDRYCLDEAAPPGSSLHYATLFATARERSAVVAIHALRRTLLGILESIADPNVRARKLNWWSDEIMESRDGRARHPVAISVTRHCGARTWSCPQILAMLSAVGRASAANGIESVEGRDRFCDEVGGGTAQLCATAVALESDETAFNEIRVLGAALEGAMLASVPIVRSGLSRIPKPASGTRRLTGAGDPDGTALGIIEERSRSQRALADAVREAPRRAGPAMLVYRTLARIQLASLANALRKPPRAVPPAASITPIRKLWIAWRDARPGG